MTVYREDANNFLIRLPIDGEANSRIVAEWRLTLIETALHLDGLKIVDLDNASNNITLESTGSKYESALRLGAEGDLQAAFEFVGGVHGFQNRTSVSITLDGIDITSMGNATYAYGDTVVVTQEIEMLYPVDGTTVAGVNTMVHTFNASGLQTDFERAFNSADAWEVFDYYGMMMPGADATLDTYQTEGFDTATMLDDNGAKQSGTEATWGERSDTGHDYRVRLTLPDGVPGAPLGWNAPGNTLKFWFQDRSDGLGKHYVNYLSSNFASRQNVAGTTHTHRAVYTVYKS